MYHLKHAPLLAAGLLLVAAQTVVAENAETHGKNATAATVTVSLDRERIQRRVSYRDLDLSSPQGMSTLYARIRSAVHAVCPREDTRDLQRLNEMRQCRWSAAEEGMRQVQRLASLQKAPLSAGLKP